MDLQSLRDALVAYLLFIPLLTFHEWAHAWTAWKCGDDTAKKLGRVSLNPIVHMELVGTVVLPLAALIFALPIFGWGKPVPVNPHNLKHPRLQDTLIAMAGPAMNLLLAWALVGFVRLGNNINNYPLAEIAETIAKISLILCFFNLIPIPPLDGSHLLMNLTRMSYQTFARLSMAGFFVILILLQFPLVGDSLFKVISVTYVALARMWGFG